MIPRDLIKAIGNEPINKPMRFDFTFLTDANAENIS
jgi:hypothetical protein